MSDEIDDNVSQLDMKPNSLYKWRRSVTSNSRKLRCATPIYHTTPRLLQIFFINNI